MLLLFLVFASATSSILGMKNVDTSTITSPKADQAAKIILSPKRLVPNDNHSVPKPGKTKKNKIDQKRAKMFGKKNKKK